MDKSSGSTLAATAVRLVVLSIVVGVIMTALGLEPRDLFLAIKSMLHTLSHMGFGIFEQIFGYFLAGAIIVLPVWLVARLFKSVPPSQKSKSRKAPPK